MPTDDEVARATAEQRAAETEAKLERDLKASQAAAAARLTEELKVQPPADT